jgi:hypothetical protein
VDHRASLNGLHMQRRKPQDDSVAVPSELSRIVTHARGQTQSIVCNKSAGGTYSNHCALKGRTGESL